MRLSILTEDEVKYPYWRWGSYRSKRYSTCISLVAISKMNMTCLRIVLIKVVSTAWNIPGFERKSLYYGRKLVGFWIRKFVNLSLKRCFKECENRPKCMSFNYEQKSHLCELTLSDKTEWQHWMRSCTRRSVFSTTWSKLTQFIDISRLFLTLRQIQTTMFTCIFNYIFLMKWL